MSVGSRLAIATDGFRGGSGEQSTAYYTGQSIPIVTDTSKSTLAMENSEVLIMQDKPNNYLSVDTDKLTIMGTNKGDYISLG